MFEQLLEQEVGALGALVWLSGQGVRGPVLENPAVAYLLAAWLGAACAAATETDATMF